MNASILLPPAKTLPHTTSALPSLTRRCFVSSLLALTCVAYPITGRAQERNTKVGEGAMNSFTSGSDNTAFGYATLKLALTYSRNTAIGAWALFAPNLGDDNTAVGYDALSRPTVARTRLSAVEH